MKRFIVSAIAAISLFLGGSAIANSVHLAPAVAHADDFDWTPVYAFPGYSLSIQFFGPCCYISATGNALAEGFLYIYNGSSPAIITGVAGVTYTGVYVPGGSIGEMIVSDLYGNIFSGSYGNDPGLFY